MRQSRPPLLVCARLTAAHLGMGACKRGPKQTGPPAQDAKADEMDGHLGHHRQTRDARKNNRRKDTRRRPARAEARAVARVAARAAAWMARAAARVAARVVARAVASTETKAAAREVAGIAGDAATKS